MLDENSKRKLGLTEEEFLVREDVTGAGPNSYFTPPDQRTTKHPINTE